MIKLVKKSNISSVVVPSIASIIASVSFFASTSQALAGANVQTLRLSTGMRYQTTEEGFYLKGMLENPATTPRWDLGVHYHYDDQPLVEFDPRTNLRVQVPVENIQTLQPSISYRRKDFSVTAQLPLHTVKLAGQSTQAALGDIRLVGQLPLGELHEGKSAFSLVPELNLPTGNSTLFVSNGGWGVGAKLAFEHDFDSFLIAANAGVLFFSDGTHKEIDYRRQLPWSVASVITLNPHLWLNVELTQSATFPLGSVQNPGELYIGTRFDLGRGVLGNAGLSLGGLDFQRSNDFRIQLGVRTELYR